MSDPIKATLVDIIHEWLGQSGLRKIWGIEPMDYPSFSGDGTVTVGNIFLRENDVPYFMVWRRRVEDKGDHKRMVEMQDPEFFAKLRKMLDEREASQTIICRCPKCEGTKL